MDYEIPAINIFAKEQMNGSELAHDVDHVNRVVANALLIAKSENYPDMDIVYAAANLHDIGLKSAPKRSLHGEEGAKIARPFLESLNIFSLSQINKICHAIQFHNQNRQGFEPLDKIIRDADILDLLGKIGIQRAYESKSHLPEFNPENIKGETWGMTAKDFDKRFDEGIGIGQTIVDQLNFQASCYHTLSSDSAKAIALPLVEEMKKYILDLEVKNKKI